MLKAKSFLTVDFGAANLKAAEFEVSEAGGLLLRQYGLRSLGQEGTQEQEREAALIQALKAMIEERGFASKNANVCAPGFNTFSKFVKLPPVDTSKVTQIIQYEAQQNVPFPLEEVVWDYQILGAAASGELEVLLVAIKTDVVEGLFRVVESAGLKLQLADVSPASLCNAFRYNYGDLEGCTMLLDIGAKTSNLIFFENGHVYSRSINIGAQSITLDFSRESRLSFAEAEQIKIAEGFVGLGGAYEEPENPHQAAISKIARQVMTRLHIQMNQTVQYYRGQQGGGAPDRLFLAGGASIMPYTAQFFAEKMNVTVEYFNPLRNVEIDPALDREELVKVAHSLGELVGLALRNLAHCPVELNLMPASVQGRQELAEKKPYFIASFCALILVLLAIGFFYHRVSDQKQVALNQLSEQVAPLKRNENTLKSVMRDVKTAQSELGQYTKWMEDRLYWSDLLTQLREVFLTVEAQKDEELKPHRAQSGIWIERMIPLMESGPVKFGPVSLLPGPQGTGPATPAPQVEAIPAEFADLISKQPAASAAGKGTGTPAPTNAITRLYLYCRGVNLNHVKADANTKLTFAIAEALKSREDLAEPVGTDLFGDLVMARDQLTFTFQLTLRLKRPLQF